MSNTFSGLEIGKRALNYFKQSIETAGHNISNADTDGYSRQRVDASASEPYSAPGMNSSGEAGQIGTGVEIDAITRIRDSFLDSQYREEYTDQNYWDAASQTLEYLETFINEPSENGISAALDTINESLQELQKDPSSSTNRESFVSEMDSLCSLINEVYENMSDYRTSLNDEIKTEVQNANSLIDSIASLNNQIRIVTNTGNTPNDLLDERDELVNELSGLAEISVSEDDSGIVNISLNGNLLVQGSETNHLVLVADGGNSGFYDVQVEGSEFSSSTNSEAATAAIGREAEEGVYSVKILRTASETNWSVGNGNSTGVTDSADEALGIEGSFSIQVGTNGSKATSSAISGGILLSAPSGSDEVEYSFRIAAGSEEQVVNVSWNDSTSHWEINGTDVGNEVDLSELANAVNGMSSDIEASVDASGEKISFSSSDGYLVSITDLQGDMVGSSLGIEKSYPSVDIEVSDTDSLQTIANKINAAYGASDDSPDSPEEWLHASVEEASDGSFYLALESNSVGEAYRINISTSDGGSLATAEKLGLVNSNGTVRNMECAEDALVKVDGMEYLSSANSFSEARLVTSYNSYQADTLQTVIDDVELNLTEGSAGSSTDIIVERQIEGGLIGGLLESRDNLVTDAIDFLNEFATSMSDQFNAILYSGHGSGDDYSETTGVAFFDPLDLGEDAAGSISVNEDILNDKNLLGATGDDGSGSSSGSGDSSKILQMLNLFTEDVFDGGSSTLDEYYTSFVSSLGSQSQQASLMYDNQETLTDQISTQISSVSGVNIDEETIDIIEFQQSYQAIARYITALDEMLDTVISGMGVVGR